MVGQRHQAPVALPLPVGGKADAPARQNRVLGKISCDATGAVVPVVSIAAHRVQRTHRPAQGSELFRDVTAQFIHCMAGHQFRQSWESPWMLLTKIPMLAYRAETADEVS